MLSTKKEELFETMSVPKAVLSLAIPTVISSLVMIVYNLADTYYVGMLNDSVQNASIALGGPVLLAYNAVNNLFGVGSSSVMSRALGKKDYKRVSSCSILAIYSSLICGLVISVMYALFYKELLGVFGAEGETAYYTKQYLDWTTGLGAAPAILNVVMAYMVRSEGSTLHASIGTMSGCIMNIILDPVFILPAGLNMGIEGAGMATFISNCFACTYFVLYIVYKRQETNISFNFFQLDFKWEIIFSICWVGVPASIQNLLNVLGMTILNNITSDYGPDVVAAMGIAQKIDMIPVNIVVGMSQGIMPMISYTYARGNIERMKHAFKFALIAAISFGCVVLAVYFISAELIMCQFIQQKEVIRYGKYFIRGLCLMIPFMCIDFLSLGVFQACGKGHLSLFMAILRKIVLEIPAIYLLNWLFPIYGLPYARLCAESVVAFICLLLIIRFFK